MGENVQGKSSLSTSYNFQGSSVKIVISLAKGENNSDTDKTQVSQPQKNEGFQKITILITTDDFDPPNQKQTTLSETGNSNFKTAHDEVPLILVNSINSKPDEEVILFPNHVSKPKNYKLEDEKNDINVKSGPVEDLGTKEKKSKGLWHWVRAAMTPELYRKSRKDEVIEISGDLEKSNFNDVNETVSQSVNHEVKEEAPKLEETPIECNKAELLKDKPNVVKALLPSQKTSVDSFHTCAELSEAATIFDVTKVEEPIITSEVPMLRHQADATQCPAKINNHMGEVQEELVYSSFTGGDQPEQDEELVAEDANSLFHKSSEEGAVESYAKEKSDVKATNEESSIITRQHKSSFIARLDKAMKRYSKRKTDENIVPTTETFALVTDNNEIIAIEELKKQSEEEHKTSTLKNAHDESSCLEDVQDLFLDTPLNVNLPGDTQDVVLLEYRKRYEELYDLV